MSKDPAILFYTSDFLAGTITMTNEQVGMYIRLLCIQHSKGELSEKDMLNICNSYDEDIYSKFVKTDAGKYYNVRLREVVEKRENYSKSRSDNRKGKSKQPIEPNNICKTYDNHMGNGNGNINGNKKRSVSTTPCDPPLESEVKQYALENGYEPDFIWEKMQAYIGNGMLDSQGKPVRNWKMKLNQVWFKPENKIKIEHAQGEVLKWS